MAEVRLTKAEVERLESDVASGAIANEDEKRVVSFLINKYRVDETQEKRVVRQADWVHNIWTWRF